MKNIRLVIFITLFAAGSVISASAQKRTAKTASARAAYGFAPAPGKQKTKKKPKARRDKTVKITRERKAGVRKRSNWAG